MPTIDRRPRARRRQDAAVEGWGTILRAMHAAGGDADAWAELRPRAIRCLAQKHKSEEAAAIFDAYARASQRKPGLFLPMLSPGAAAAPLPISQQRV
jgi:hypothetical protein